MDKNGFLYNDLQNGAVELMQQLPRNPFHSFWMAGFECSDQLNAFGNRVDLLQLSGHLDLLEDDYKRLGVFGMRTVREGIRWSDVEKKPYCYDWSSVEKMINCGRRSKIQQVWDICHFGFPDDLTPLHPMFARRFAALCRSFVEFYRSIDGNGTLVITPINEVSFLSWLGGDARGTSPYCVGQGWEVKYHLMKAYIEGVEAILEVDPSVRILTTEPLVNIIPAPSADPGQVNFANALHEDQFQVTDMLSGRMCPELRGRPEYLDILGYNYYFNNQWVCDPFQCLDWRDKSELTGNVPLNELLLTAFKRYGCPIVLSETSHPKEDRPLWIEMIASECKKALLTGLPLWGICWYPIIDRPDWDFPGTWHESGLWDGAYRPGYPGRVLHLSTAKALLNAQEELKIILEQQNNRKSNMSITAYEDSIFAV